MRKEPIQELMKLSIFVSAILAFCFISMHDLVANEPPKQAKRIAGRDVGLLILGTIVSKDSDKSVVLIKDTDTGKVSAFKKEYVIFSKYKVLGIDSKYILVATKKTDSKPSEMLAVYQDKFAGEMKKAAPKALAGNSKKYSEDGFERVEKDDEGSIDVAMTQAYRDKIVKKELSTILMQATASPILEDGSIVGFELSQIDEGSIYEKGGFQNNDVVTAVNGIPLDSVSGAIKLLNSLKKAEDLEVDIRRGSHTKRMSISVK